MRIQIKIQDFWKCAVFLVLTILFGVCDSVIGVDQIPGGQKGPVVLSPVALRNLARAEIDIYKSMKELVTGLEAQLALAKDYVNDYEDSTVKGTNHVVNDTAGRETARLVANHPFLTFRMMRRFAKKVIPVQNYATLNYESKFTARLKGISNGREWPGKKEFEDVIASIFRVQNMYNLNVAEISEGNFEEIATKVDLSTNDCFEIANFALQYDYFTVAMEWFRVTKAKVKYDKMMREERRKIAAAATENSQMPAFDLTEENFIDENLVASNVRRLIKNHDDKWEGYKMNSNYFIFDSKIETSEAEVYNKTLRKFVEYRGELDQLEANPTFEESTLNFMALCNGYNLQTDAQKARLKCWYEKKKHPYWFINPLKMEILNDDPLILQAYEFIGDKFITNLQHLAIPILDQPPPIQDEYTTPRSAMYAWLADEEYPQLESFIRRIEFITGLNAHGIHSSTPLQVASYAFGGYVATHWDSFGEDTTDPRGDRVLTALFYMNDVTKGGLTGFPLLGANISPIKGSAVFWYLAKKNGKVDRRMLHGACPVIMGEKWIATKWIHLKENFLKRPCSLNEED